MSVRSVVTRALVLLLVATVAVAQTPPLDEETEQETDGTQREEESQAEEQQEIIEPEPWNKDEFAPWLVDTRRAEVIALGAFPVAMLVNSIVYQLGRFIYVSADRGSFATDVAPWFFRTAPGARYTLDEQTGLLISASALSVMVATIDYVVGRRSRR